MSVFKPENFFNPENPVYTDMFFGIDQVWEALKNIPVYLEKHLKPNIPPKTAAGPVVTKTLTLDNGAQIHAGAAIMGEDIHLAADVTVEPGALIKGPCIIGPGTQVRQGAYIRGNLITGRNCVIGHCTEVKNSVMLGESKAGHFAYIGDSILGSVNLGAGTKLANLKLHGSNITISCGDEKHDTGLRKCGAVLGDGVETGCNSVTAPGTLIARNSMLYPNTTAAGYYGPGTVIKLRQTIEKGEFRE